MTEAPTPMMRQYHEQKRRFPDHLLLFRLGDFYELFADDAQVGARLLSITLTSRQGVPMAGIPHHAAESYIARLVRAGRKIAVCEQMELPGPGKKLLRRDVVRVITPGTITDTAYLPGAANNFLLAVGRLRDEVGVALVDVSTGEFWCGEERAEGPVLAAALLRRPAEILLPETLRTTDLAARLSATGATLTFCDAGAFAVRTARTAVVDHFGESTVGTAGLHDMTVGLGAAAAALGYLRATQGDALGHMTRLARLTATGVMTLDETAVSTLELLEASDGDGRHSLFAVLNETVTPMGARLLRAWLLRPLTDVLAIAARQTAIGDLVQDPAARAALRAAMRGVGDLERLTSRAALGAAHARDLVGLRHCLRPLGTIRGLAAPLTSSLVTQAIADLHPLDDLEATLADALVDEPPLVLHDGGLIREAWSEELAALVADAREARAWIASLEERERTRTGISSLRVRFNRVFGYGIEVSHGQVARVPAEYIRRQTLTGAERYVTTELKEYEGKVLGADERRKKLEYELFDGLRRAVAARAPELVRTAGALALLDVVAALAEVAHTHRHVRPAVDDSHALSIVDGRHPVLEARGSAPVTPNDVDLDDDRRIVILTGPNMAGKSVYLRQVGHLVILAQMGAWVPAREARIGVVDRVFTRVGAQDNVSRGQSTFLVEMVETATIMRHVTPRSLVLLDEVGRGTSTFDGLAIAWAVVEHLHGESRAKVLFATHFHELTRLGERLAAVRNFHVAVREWNDEIVFLHKVRPGSTDRSYGIQVARLAGLPPAVIRRAKELLVELEAEGQRRSDADDAVQLGLWEKPDDPVLTEIAQLDVSHLTPLEALNRLAKLRERVLSIRCAGDPEGRADAPVMAPRPPTLGPAPAQPGQASGD